MNTPEENMALPQHPYPSAPVHQVEVVGALWQAHFPSLCVRCGEASARNFPIYKLFYRMEADSPTSYLIGALEVPVCAVCLQLQEREQKPISPEIRGRLLRRWFFEVLPFFFPFGCAVWFLKIVIPLLSKSLLHHSHLWEPLITGGLCAFFGAAAFGFFNLARMKGEQLLYDAGHIPPNTYALVEPGPLGCRFVVPAEPTSLQRAVDFTDNLAETFDAERHLYRFENTTVAAQFAEANAHHTWRPNSPQALRAAKARLVLMIVLGAFVLYSLVMGLLGRG